MSDMENIKSYWNEISKLTMQRDELAAALQLAKDMMIANDLNLINTFEVIDKALLKVKDSVG